MTEQFFTALHVRLVELTADLRYLHKPTGVMIAPQIIDLMLPRPKEVVSEADEYPFVRWLVHKGEYARKGLIAFSVVVDGGIYVAGGVTDGNAAIAELCTSLGKIVDVPMFSFYRLADPVRFSIGVPDSEERNPGIQGHPYYHCRLFMDFSLSRHRL